MSTCLRTPTPLAPLQEGFAGDVIGLTNPGAFAIADTLVGLGSPVLAFPPIPTFTPELFAYMRCPPNQKKPFLKGVEGRRVQDGQGKGWVGGTERGSENAVGYGVGQVP